MKKILKYSTILGVAIVMGGTSLATADTGGYVRIKGMESYFHSIGFNQIGCVAGGGRESDCLLADESRDEIAGTGMNETELEASKDNELFFGKDDGVGVVVGADYGFFRLEVEGTYQDSKAKLWRGHTATGGTVYQARLFANIVVEPLELFELIGEFGGVNALVKYNPAHYGISPYAMYGYGVMGGLLSNLAYTRTNSSYYSSRTADAKENGAWGGGAVAAVNVGAGVNIGLDKLAKSLSEASGTSIPEYFKLPIEFSVGYHFQADVGDLLFESINEDLGIDDGGLTYSVGLKW